MSTLQEIMESPRKKVLVIGGGIASLTCAGHLSKLGLSVILIEKEHFIGGKALNFFCKATDTCRKCNYCLVEERLSEIVRDPQVTILTQAQLDQSESLGNGSFSVVIRQRPSYIDPSKCNNCGICFQVCPAVDDGAVIKGLPSSATHPIYAINKEACLYYKDSQARLCQDSCPEKAIDLDRHPVDHHLQVEALVLASGYTPFDPQNKPNLGYGRVPNVITAMELERMMRTEGQVLRPSDRKQPQRIAFIQCVGSRDKVLNHLFCSRICCGYALRMGRAIKHRWSSIESYVFFMDIQNFGKEFLPLYEEAKETLTLIRGIPGSINKAPGERVALTYQTNGGEPPREEIFDLLVLSIGLMPAEENKTWAARFNLPLNEDGFLAGGNSTGIFLAGTVSGPMDISESIAHGAQASREVADYLGIRMK